MDRTKASRCGNQHSLCLRLGLRGQSSDLPGMFLGSCDIFHVVERNEAAVSIEAQISSWRGEKSLRGRLVRFPSPVGFPW